MDSFWKKKIESICGEANVRRPETSLYSVCTNFKRIIKTEVTQNKLRKTGGDSKTN